MTDDTIYCPCCDTPLEVDYHKVDSGRWRTAVWCYLCEAGWPSVEGDTKAESLWRMMLRLAPYLPGSTKARDAYVPTLAEIEDDSDEGQLGQVRDHHAGG